MPPCYGARCPGPPERKQSPYAAAMPRRPFSKVSSTPAMVLPDPMLLTEGGVTPLGKPGWIYEVKYDGWRLVAGKVGRQVNIRTRSGADYTATFPEIVEALAALPGGPHILDGEGVILDDTGRSDFNRFQDRALPGVPPVAGADAAVFMVFDMLMLDGQAMIELPVEDRKARLLDLIGPARGALRYSEHFPAEHGRSLFQQAKQLKLEGLVAKRLGSWYRPGERSTDWVKVKVPGAVPAERFKR